MQVLCDPVSTHRNLCCDAFEALEVSVLTQVQNDCVEDRSRKEALEVSVLTQVQNNHPNNQCYKIALEVSVLAQIQNDRKFLYKKFSLCSTKKKEQVYVLLLQDCITMDIRIHTNRCD